MSGYCDCACRDCFEIAIGDGEGPATADAIAEAVCPAMADDGGSYVLRRSRSGEGRLVA